MKPLNQLVIIFFITISTFAQERKIKTLALSDQFNEIYRISSSYKENKVIKKVLFENLKANVLDSVEHIYKELQSKSQRNIFLKDSLDITKKKLRNLNSEIQLIIKEKNSISMFGIRLSKISYKVILSITLLLLIIILSYSFYEYKNSFHVTSEAKRNLIKVENEFTDFIKKSLEREQKLGRQLQDEINKQQGV
jgi:hypothetical protein|tara:strand:+ start:39 stop:620 length:582 start_codon:yes stop_codon:yes gene_type:complete